MKRLKQKTKNKAVIMTEAAAAFEKIGQKQVVGHCVIKHFGEDAQNFYSMEDGTIVVEDDSGKVIKKAEKIRRRKKEVLNNGE